MKHSKSTIHKPTLAIISHTLRRDMEEPLRHFRKLRILHLYSDARYKDMQKADYVSEPIRYRSAREVEQLLGTLKPNIIQGPEPYASRVALKNAWVVYRYTKRTGTPYFFPVFENRPAEIKFGPLVGAVMKRILAAYAAGAVGVITLNNGARDNLLAVGVPKHKITRLNWGTWGIPINEFKPAKSKRIDRPTVLFVGRISAKKGLDTLLDAWETILATVPTAQLIVGGPALDHDGQKLVGRLEQTPAVSYVGPIKNAELPAYFQQAWVTVAPSVTTKIWAEQVGMIALQSLSCGTPVVTTKSGAIPDYVGTGNGAVLIDEHDSAAIAKETVAILGDPALRDQLGAAGRKHIAAKYEVKENVRKGEQFILGLLEQNAKARN